MEKENKLIKEAKQIIEEMKEQIMILDEAHSLEMGYANWEEEDLFEKHDVFGWELSKKTKETWGISKEDK